MDPEQLAAKLRNLTAPFTSGQLVTLALTFVIVIGVVIASAMWLQKPTYRLLQADLDPETMGQVVSRLKSLKVPYELDEGGRGIRVPASRIDELRLEFAASGGSESGLPGWKLFDGQDFGITEFGEKIKYRRAMEGEMARTIATLAEVSSARVHIAMGKEELFGESRPATASVVLKLKAGRSLPTSAVNGITNLVAGAVDGMKAESVIVLDNYGRPLTRPKVDENDPAGAASMERQQRLEREYAQRVVAMLEPIVGADHVRVNVALSLKRQTTEQTQETWDPNATVVRSQQTTSETMNSGATALATPPPGVVPGTAGSRSNLPAPAPNGGTGAAPLTTAQGPTSQRTSETKNNEIGVTKTHTIQPAGEIERLSVAVIVDDDQQVKAENGKSTVTRNKRTPDELKKFENLVASSVGLNSERGDRVTVENIAFDEPLAEEIEAPSVLVKYQPQIEETARVVGLVVVVVLAFFFVIRPLMSKVSTGVATTRVTMATAGGGARPRTVAELEGEIEAQLDAAETKGDRKLPVLTKRVADGAIKEPEHVAKVLRSWMKEEVR
ncbi:MAG TPA: flagellar basal-body MS-ring/collar protein FliF [Vicinamibacterales bacterium]|jgi:flagellar M-ring protein FliF|nr:flagellar basal-body MS-ring/collar protein FliF [Vicinamibacterales bacterium]